MTQWSKDAANELEAYLSRQRNALGGEEVDIDEILGDLRSHIDEEIKNRGLQVVTREDVAEILRRLGPLAGREEQRAAPAPASDAPSAPPLPTSTPGITLMIFGIFLPAVSLLVELASHCCARVFFDPIPTWWHVLLVASVPIINALVIYRIRQGTRLWPKLFMAANAAAIVIAAFYAAAFATLLFPGLFAVVWFGFGLLPMGPLFALIAAIRCRYHLKLFFGKSLQAGRESVLGFAVAVAILGVLEFANIAARIGLELADSPEPAVQARGMSLLRNFGSETMMLRACYERPRKFTNLAALLISPDNPVYQKEARRIFFRATGKPFNAVRPPRLYSRTGRWEALDELAWDVDEGLGGTAVAGRVRGLDLVGSRLDGRVHTQAGLAYLEWTFEFTNQSTRQREARAQILLPPGAVVSRLTLWVNGEEREAAFAGRAQTRQAYQEVAVRQRRDPVLVTTSGPDRILMQCFPVPPNGGAMKARIGITAPLAMTNPRNGKLPLPKMLERNFGLLPDLKHALWIESKSELSSPLNSLNPGVLPENPKGGKNALAGEILTLHGQIADADLLSPRSAIRVVRAQAVQRVQTAAPELDKIILQELIPAPPLNFDRLALVIDGSNGMAPFYAEIARSLAQLPPSIELFLIHASDTDQRSRTSNTTPVDKDAAAAQIANLQALGGQDNLNSLVRAWEIAAGGQNGVVLWIHGPQPIALGSDQVLRQRLERSPAHPKLFEMQTATGPNRLLEQLEANAVQSLPRFDSLENDLADWLRLLGADAGPWYFQRRAVSRESAAGLHTVPNVTDHVRRLWAAAQIETLAAKGDPDAAVQMASRQQLVTSVSGAVVLETKEQFDRAGLSPVDPATVPAIPEPETWLLLCLGAWLLCWFHQRRRPLRP